MLPWIPLAQVSPVIGGAAATNQAVPAVPVAGPGPAAPVAPVAPVTGAVSGPTTSTSAPGGTTPPVENKPQGPQGLMGILMNVGPILLIVVVLYFFMFRGPRKDEKARKSMIGQMKRGDEVMTIGGLIGKVVEVREDRVVLKVDEGNNVKETYLKSAIQKVLSPEVEDRK